MVTVTFPTWDTAPPRHRPYTFSGVGWPTAAWRSWVSTPRGPQSPGAKDPSVAERPRGAADPPGCFFECDFSGWWYTHPSEKYESQLGWWHSQSMEKYNMFQTTKQFFHLFPLENLGKASGVKHGNWMIFLWSITFSWGNNKMVMKSHSLFSNCHRKKIRNTWWLQQPC